MWESCGNIARRLRTRGKKTKYVQLITLHSLYTQKANMLNSTCASMTWTYVAFLSLSLSFAHTLCIFHSPSLSYTYIFTRYRLGTEIGNRPILNDQLLSVEYWLPPGIVSSSVKQNDSYFVWSFCRGHGTI